MKEKEKTKVAEIHLPLFKQGDDFGHHLSECKTPKEALEAYAVQLEDAASMLREIKDIVGDNKVEFQADTHWISVEGPESVIEALIAAELGEEPDFDDDDEFDEIDCEDECDDEE